MQRELRQRLRVHQSVVGDADEKQTLQQLVYFQLKSRENGRGEGCAVCVGNLSVSGGE